MSPAVAMPGRKGIPDAIAALLSGSVRPGETMKRAPASRLASRSASFRTVPAPTIAPFHLRHLADRVERDRRAQRHLQRAQTTGDQRFGNRASISDIVDHEHRDDRRKLHDAVNIVHRPMFLGKGGGGAEQTRAGDG